jgi:2-desacetyl-2-hydroxyethyl bacteriochlorophyllide A dehydrogenase
MKAANLEAPRKLTICDLPKPVAGPGEAVLKVKYAGICGSDITVYKGDHPTATLPVVPCHEILGVIDSIDAPGSGFQVGDRVTVDPLISCGVCEACRKGHTHVCKSLKLLGIHENGGFAEYTKVSVSKMVHVPQALSDKVAALSEPFAVGYHVMHRSGIRMGDSALVIGGGPIGLVVALTARAAGASVVISEPNEKREALAKSFGFETINPAKEDASAAIARLTNGDGFDVVYEASGSKAGILQMTDACKIRGTMVPMSLSGKAVDFQLGKVSFKELTVVGSRVYEHYHFERGVELLERLSKDYDLSKVATEIYPLEQIQKGFDEMLDGTATGKILIEF